MATIDPSQLSPAERAAMSRYRASQISSGERMRKLPKSLQKVRTQFNLGRAAGSSTPTGSTLAGKAGRGAAKASAATKTAGKAAGKLAAPVGLTLEAANAFGLATDADKRKAAEDRFDELGENAGFLGAIENALRGAVSPTDTIYGAAQAALERDDDKRRARKSAAELERKMGEGGQELVDTAGERQETSRAVGQDLMDQIFMDLKASGDMDTWKSVRDMTPEEVGEFAEAFYAEDEPAAEPAAKPAAKPAAEPAAEMPAAESEEAPKAKALLTPEKAQELFSTIHGGSFDPKSRMDKQKMAQIEELAMELGPDAFEAMSPNQFALRIYRDYDYV